MEILKETELMEQAEREEQEFWKPEIKQTYHVPKYNLDFLMEQVDKLNKRARKLNLEPIVVEELNEYDKTIVSNDVGYYRRTEITIRYVEVRITG